MVLAVIIGVLVFLGLSTTGVLVESIERDELRNMGVSKRSENPDAGRDLIGER